MTKCTYCGWDLDNGGCTNSLCPGKRQGTDAQALPPLGEDELYLTTDIEVDITEKGIDAYSAYCDSNNLPKFGWMLEAGKHKLPLWLLMEVFGPHVRKNIRELIGFTVRVVR